MATILDEIVANKKIEVEQFKRSLPIAMLREGGFFCRETFSFKKALIDSSTGIISEFKRRSPSKGDI
ncbi:MAG: indole-3-glycerol-phosphate synthase TrpC, partial [Bacteroidales bacterium]|nr:indole-3-glycerol-phosphate synthase TrpC [Bacteroidales bacterium]